MTASRKKTPTRKEVERRLRALLDSGEYKAIRRGDVIERIKAVKSGKSTPDHASIEEINEFISKHGLELKEEEGKKRRYRRKDERPDPDQPSNAEVNRLRKNFQARVEWTLAEEVDEAIRRSGKTRQEWVEEALSEKLERDR